MRPLEHFGTFRKPIGWLFITVMAAAADFQSAEYAGQRRVNRMTRLRIQTSKLNSCDNDEHFLLLYMT